MHRSHLVALSLVVVLAIVCPFQTLAQSDQKQQDLQNVCDEQQALLLIHQQVETVKSLEVTPAGIAVMIRAGDMLWLRHTDAARAIFARAYEMAEKDFQEKGDATAREGRLTVQLPDQRFSVMQAIARHDSKWARSLAEQVAEETRRKAEKARIEAQNAVTSNTQNDSSRKVADKLLTMASSLLATDEKAAIGLAGNAIASADPSSALKFLFTLANTNQAAADQLCHQTINAYAGAAMEGLFYTAGYVFLTGSNIGPSRVGFGMPVPKSLSPNSALQQLYLDTLFRRAELSLRPQTESPSATQTSFPEPAEFYLALEKLEPLIARYLPSSSERAAAIKNTLRASLASDVRQQADATVQQGNQEEVGSQFERYLERAERETNSNRRDEHLAWAAMSGLNTETAERVIDVARKVTDQKLRSQVLNYIYFRLTQKAIEKGDFDEARRLAENVEQLDQRAYLSYEIAAQLLKKLEDRARAREALDEVVSAASKAPNTNEKARTLLGIAHLYAKFDPIRAFEVMAEAVKTINYIENPDFSRTVLIQRIEGASFSRFTSINVEGFSLETSFSDLAPFDFNGALLIAQGLENRPVRATAILALAKSCMETPKRAGKRVQT